MRKDYLQPANGPQSKADVSVIGTAAKTATEPITSFISLLLLLGSLPIYQIPTRVEFSLRISKSCASNRAGAGRPGERPAYGQNRESIGS